MRKESKQNTKESHQTSREKKAREKERNREDLQNSYKTSNRKAVSTYLLITT